jgi:hypothetical protein
VPVPAPVPAPPPGVNLAAERTAIEELLGRYVEAYNNMDEGRLRQIDPTFRGIPSRSMLRSVTLKMSNVSIDVAGDGQSASLRATQNFTYVANRAQFPPTSTGMLNWKLRKNGAVWSVVP